MAKTKNNMIYGIFNNADAIMSSVKKLRGQGVEIHDCYTPYPVHNLDKEMGVKRSNLTIGAFICGALGTLTAIVFELYVMVFDWPMNIGGKPNDGYFPSFIPVTFELTILFTAFGMGILFFIRAKMIHGKVEDLVDIRQTDDHYVIAIEEKGGNFDKESVNRTMIDLGAIEIKETQPKA